MFGVLPIDHGHRLARADQERAREPHALVAGWHLLEAPETEQRFGVDGYERYSTSSIWRIAHRSSVRLT